MIGIKNAISEIEVISPEEEDCFFGYYDLNAFDSTGTKHLCHKVTQIHEIPKDGETAELGILEKGCFVPITKTSAWNFQQGAMLQYQKNSDDVIFYNERIKDSYVTTVHNLKEGKKIHLPKPAGCISPNGKYALSINFSRIFQFRKGYGYVGIADPFEKENHPKEDGIFLTEIDTGKTKLLIDYERMYKVISVQGLECAKLVVNHITFNETSDRFVFLLRNFPDGTQKEWGTTMVTSDLSGNMHVIIKNKFVSHYCWKNGKQILAFCTPYSKAGLFLIDDIINHFTELRAPYPTGPFGGDIHCIYSPDKRYILGDGYPDEEGYRPLFLYDTETERIKRLLRSKSTLDQNWDIRCDLHARFNRNGTKISFDSAHDGRRHICEMALV